MRFGNAGGGIMNYQPPHPINLDSLRWAQEKQLLVRHREQTQMLKYLKSVRMGESRTYVQTLQQRTSVEEDLRRLQGCF